MVGFWSERLSVEIGYGGFPEGGLPARSGNLRGGELMLRDFTLRNGFYYFHPEMS